MNFRSLSIEGRFFAQGFSIDRISTFKSLEYFDEIFGFSPENIFSFNSSIFLALKGTLRDVSS